MIYEDVDVLMEQIPADIIIVSLASRATDFNGNVPAAAPAAPVTGWSILSHIIILPQRGTTVPGESVNLIPVMFMV